MRYFLFLSSSHLLAISQNSTHATTAYIRNMKPYMKELALKPDEELEEAGSSALVEEEDYYAPAETESNINMD